MTSDELRAQAREILNRHLEYTDGLDRGQIVTKTSLALDAIVEALQSRPSPGDVERVDDDLIERVARAICGVNEPNPDEHMLPGTPCWVALIPEARAAIDAMRSS